MKYALLLTVVVGCSTSQPSPTAWQQAMRISGETIVAKQDESITILKENTTALAAIKSQIETLNASQVESETSDGIGGDLESDAPPNDNTAANESLDSSPGSQPVESSAVQLFITTADFYCPPCLRMKRDIEAGEFAEFDIKYVPEFDGQKSFPATRFRSAESPTGWLVVYGYDDTTLATIKERAGVLKVVSIPAKAKSVVTNSDLSTREMFELHNSLHGGGEHPWPGDLATHLQTTHGIDTGGEQPVSGSFFPVSRQPAIQSSRSVIRANTWGQGFFGRSRIISR